MAELPEPMTQFLRTELDPATNPVAQALQQNLINSSPDPAEYAECLAIATMMLELHVHELHAQHAQELASLRSVIERITGTGGD